MTDGNIDNDSRDSRVDEYSGVESVLEVPRTLKQSIKAWWNYTDDDGLKSQHRMFSKLPFNRVSKDDADKLEEPTRVAFTSLVDISHPSFTNPVKINTLEIGQYPKPSDQDEVPIVCSHGYAAATFFFLNNLQALGSIPKTRFYGMDVLGMGLSERVKFPNISSSQPVEKRVAAAEDFFTDALEAWRKAQGLNRMILVGHSLGGYLSTVYALRYPQHVRKLILISPIGFPNNPEIATQESLNQDLQEAQTETRSHEFSDVPETHKRIPVTFMHGSVDWVSGGLEAFNKMKEMGFQVKYEETPKAGHHLYLDNPEDFNSKSMSITDKQIGEWCFGREIGKGSFAIVYHGWHSSSNPKASSCAIKSVIRSRLTAKLLDNLEAEISILKRIQHPNVVGLLDCIKTPTHIHLVTSYCSGGDLSCYIKKRGEVPTLEYWPSGFEGVGHAAFYKHPQLGGLDERVVRSFSGQLAQALLFLRSQDLMHRDIKPQNLLLQPPDTTAIANGHPIGIPILRVADFGFARNLPAATMAETLCGSPLYMAPEILRYEKYDAKADLWSVGAVMYEMTTGRPPFRAQNHVELLRKIEKSDDKIKFPSSSEVDIPRDIKDIIRSLLKRHPIERISFDEFFSWPGFDSFEKDSKCTQNVYAEAAKETFGTSPLSISKPVQSTSRPPLTTHVTSPDTSNNAVATTRRPSFTPKYIVGPSRAATTNAVPSTSPKSSSPREQSLARCTSLGESVEKFSGLQLGFNERINDTSETRISKFQLPANEDSIVGKEYVVIEKNAVEINNLADDMAAAARRQPVVGRLNSRGNYGGPGTGVFGDTLRRVSDPNVNAAAAAATQAKVGNTPPNNYISKFPLPGTSPTSAGFGSFPRRPSISPTTPAPVYNQAYHQVAHDVQVKEGAHPQLSHQPQSHQPKSALTRAINLASLRLFGSGTPGRVLALVKGGNKAYSYAYNEQKETDILRQLEELAQKAFVIFDFADSKLYQAIATEHGNVPSSKNLDEMSGLPPCFYSYCQQRASQDIANGVMSSKSYDNGEKLAAEAVLLYIRASTVLSQGGELVVKYMTGRSSTQTQSFSNGLNDAVQWFRYKYNDCFDKADYAKGKCGNEIIDSVEYVSQMLFERGMEIARASALDELMGEDVYKCEAAYETSLWILEGLLDAHTNDDEDRNMFLQYKTSIEKRLHGLKKKICRTSLSSLDMHHDDGTDGTDKDLDNNSLRSIRELGAATFIKRIYDDESTDDSTDIRRVIRDLDSECTGLERKSSVQLKQVDFIPQFSSSTHSTQLLKRKAIQIGKQRSRISIPETYDAAINLISISSNILVVSGAGVSCIPAVTFQSDPAQISVNRGIVRLLYTLEYPSNPTKPDFRSPDGIYDQIKRRNYPEIDEPEQIFDLVRYDSFKDMALLIRNAKGYLCSTSKTLLVVAKNIMPTRFSPGPAHKFVKDSDTLLRNYTQNIDSLERKAGVDLLLECHGTFAFLECLRCGEMYNTDVAPLDVSDDAVITFFDTKNEDIPYLKPTIVSIQLKISKRTHELQTFFGEDVHSDYEQRVLDDSQATDLILVLGTSMSVAPISEFISHIPHKVPIVVINKTPIKGLEPDGDIDSIVLEIHSKLDKIKTEL
ncbi:hypothetical protein E3P94_03875 [Wallemia ichthyophaga]|nr:hypothetical protein E3P94_03875 [Wallemia ichthyophaga]